MRKLKKKGDTLPVHPSSLPVQTPQGGATAKDFMLLQRFFSLIHPQRSSVFFLLRDGAAIPDVPLWSPFGSGIRVYSVFFDYEVDKFSS